MLNNLIFLIVFGLWTPFYSWSAHCLLTEILKNPALTSNQEFWEEYNQLSKKGKPSNEDLMALVKRHGGALEKPADAKPSTSASFSRPLELSLNNKAQKEINSLPKNLKEKVDEFLETALRADGIQEIRNNPGRWHLEKVILKGVEGYTVRLNDGYRVFFDHNDKALTIRQVNKGTIHRN